MITRSTLSPRTLAPMVVGVAVLGAAEAAARSDSPAACGPDFSNGARSLFIGHSFFVPVALRFGDIAEANGFTDHAIDTVFAGGASGAPGALWDDPQRFPVIDERLAAGDVELFGMTVGTEDSAPEAYTRWIDLALSYNPGTAIMIGVPWVPVGHAMTPEAFAVANRSAATTQWPIIQQLRAAYPGVRIDFVAYGEVSGLMYTAYDAGELPDIECVTGCNPDALFSDAGIGHAGPMMTELCALLWMDVLYDAEVSTLAFTDYESDVVGIIEQASAANGAYAQTTGADANGDGSVDIRDIVDFIEAWNAQGDGADFNSDGAINVFDVTDFIDVWDTGCP